MREVQVTCPRCGRQYGELVAEESDYTHFGNPIVYLKQGCPYCGYPNTIYEIEINDTWAT